MRQLLCRALGNLASVPATAAGARRARLSLHVTPPSKRGLAEAWSALLLTQCEGAPCFLEFNIFGGLMGTASKHSQAACCN